MDNMAYLQQIAGVNNSVAQKAQKGDNPLKKLLNIWVLIGSVILIAVLVIVAIIANLTGQVDTRDRDLMADSYWTATYLNKNTVSKYSKEVKNSDIRNMASSFDSVLSEIILNDKEFLTSYGIEIQKQNEKNDDRAKSAFEANAKLNEVLEDARLNGILDRVFLREMTMQIAYLRSYQSEIAERTKDEAAKAFAKKEEANLDNIYNRFHDFKGNVL